MANIKDSKQVKVVLLGDSGVGKSSIMLRFVTGNFEADREPTLGGAFMAKIVNFRDKSYKYQIWDTAGQEKYQSLASMYYRDAQIAILVYDVTKKDSFESLKKWVAQLKENGPPNLMLGVVGNKVDLQATVSFELAKRFAMDINAVFKETSAKENLGIDEIFNVFSEKIMIDDEKQEMAKNKMMSESIKLNDKSQIKQSTSDKKGCC